MVDSSESSDVAFFSALSLSESVAGSYWPSLYCFEGLPEPELESEDPSEPPSVEPESLLPEPELLTGVSLPPDLLPSFPPFPLLSVGVGGGGSSV